MGAQGPHHTGPTRQTCSQDLSEKNVPTGRKRHLDRAERINPGLSAPKDLTVDHNLDHDLDQELDHELEGLACPMRVK